MLAPVGPQAHPAASFHIQRPHSHVTVRLEDWPQREHDRMLLVDVSVLLCQLTSLYMLSADLQEHLDASWLTSQQPAAQGCLCYINV